MSQQIDLRTTTKASVRKIVSDRRDVADKSALRFYTIEAISEHRSYTPEGYLLCESATLSRTGTMLYKADEVPVTAGADGLVTVVRYEEDVFKPESVASANGKSVCNNHPSEGQDISPENWRTLEVGVILHPRRGTGDKKDCLVADLLVKDPEAIKLIESGKVQLSCGYDADYEEIKPGYAKQYGIIINHVAIVENGRCGPRCAIMDEDTLRLNFPSGKADFGKRKMTRGINDALISLKAALNKTTINRDSEMSSEEPDTEILALALEGLNNRLADIEKKLSMRDRRSADEEEEDRRSRDRRDARRRDSAEEEEDRRSRDRRDARRRDDDEEEESRDSRGRHHNDRYSRDEEEEARRSRDRRDARRRDSEEEEEERRSRDRRDARRRGDDEEEESHDSRDRRDVRRRDSEELENEAGEKNKDRARKAKDSAFLEDSWKETISLAECLLPGVQAPKFTRDAAPVSTLTKLCEFRKSVLTATFTKPEGRQLILDLNRGEAPDFQGMSCAAARTLFRDCAIIAKRTNNAKTVDGETTTFGLVRVNNAVIGSPAAYNEWAAKHWAGQAADVTKAN